MLRYGACGSDHDNPYQGVALCLESACACACRQGSDSHQLASPLPSASLPRPAHREGISVAEVSSLYFPRLRSHLCRHCAGPSAVQADCPLQCVNPFIGMLWSMCTFSKDITFMESTLETSTSVSISLLSFFASLCSSAAWARVRAVATTLFPFSRNCLTYCSSITLKSG